MTETTTKGPRLVSWRRQHTGVSSTVLFLRVRTRSASPGSLVGPQPRFIVFSVLQRIRFVGHTGSAAAFSPNRSGSASRSPAPTDRRTVGVRLSYLVVSCMLMLSCLFAPALTLNSAGIEFCRHRVLQRPLMAAFVFAGAIRGQTVLDRRLLRFAWSAPSSPAQSLPRSPAY